MIAAILRQAAVLAVALLCTVQAHAAYDVTIALTGSTWGGAWSGDTWTANQSGATLMASDVQAHLASGPVTVSTGSGGSEPGDITIEGDITWSANTLTLHAAHDITVDNDLIGSGTAALVLEYGQGAVAAGNTAVYRFNVPVNLTSYLGDPYVTPTFSTKRGSDGTVAGRAAPICPVLGRRGVLTYGCKFLKPDGDFTAAGEPVVFNVEYNTVEVNGAAGADAWLYINWNSAFVDVHYPYVMSCVEEVGNFYYPNSEEQENYYDAAGNITDLAGLNSFTTTTKLCQNWDMGPVYQLFSSSVFNHGYYIKYTPSTGEYGNASHVLPLLIVEEMIDNTSYKVVDYIINIRPIAPTASSAGDIALTVPATTDSTDVTLTGSGALNVSATSSNTALLPDANITGASSCTAEGTCTLAVTTTAGQYGNATVTVTATDAWGQQGSDSFTVTVLPPAPTVTGAADLSLAGTTPGSESLTLTGTGALVVTAASSNTTLLPDANITQSGCTAAGTCALTVTPAAGRTGSATVTATVQDSYGRSATTTFTVTVTTPAPPSLSAIPNISLTAPHSGSTTFTVSGTGPLTMHVIPVGLSSVIGSIQRTGDCTAAGTCTLTVTPAAHQYGTATLQVTVQDGYSQAYSRDFYVSVSRPAAPAVTGAADVNLLASATGHAAFIVNGTGALTVSATSDNAALLPDAAITGAADCDAAGGCTLWLAPTAGASGSAVVTVTVADAFGQQGTATFAVNVTPTVGVAYDGNGNTGGTAPTDGTPYVPGDTVTVVDGGGLVRDGYDFAGWNTAHDGSGVAYRAGDTFVIRRYTTLYARWSESSSTDVTLGGGAFSFEWLVLLMLLLGGRGLRRKVG